MPGTTRRRNQKKNNIPKNSVDKPKKRVTTKKERVNNKASNSWKKIKIKNENSLLNKIRDFMGSLDKDKAIKLVLFIICFVIFIYSSFVFCRWLYSNIKTSIAVNLTDKKFNDTLAFDSKENPVDFAALRQINSDVVGWIKINNTDINYPIVRTTNNDFYLKNDFYKNYSACGWIYMDYQNNPRFIDKNTVIYGHNLKTGMMFSDLIKIYNQELGKEITIDIYTESSKNTYKVFSCYKTAPESYGIKSNIVDADEFYQYSKDMLDRSEIVYNVTFEKEDKVITLSTCDATGKNRILVHAVYVNSEHYE